MQGVEGLFVDLQGAVLRVDGDAERRRRLRDRVAEDDGLAGTTDGSDGLGDGDGSGVDEDHRVERHRVRDLRDLVRRGEPDRGDRTGQVRCRVVQQAGGDRAVAELALQRGGLLRPVDEPDLPVLGELPREALGHPGRVRVVDESEVGLDPVEHVGVRAEQCPVGLQHGLERGLPPGEFELGGHLHVGDVPVRQVGEERLELQVAERLHQLGALLQVVQDVGLGGEARRSSAPGARSAGSRAAGRGWRGRAARRDARGPRRRSRTAPGRRRCRWGPRGSRRPRRSAARGPAAAGRG